MNLPLPQELLASRLSLEGGSEPFRLDRKRLGNDISLRIEEGTRMCVVDLFPEDMGEHTYTLSLSVAPRAEVFVVSVLRPQCWSSLRIVQRGVVEAGGKLHWWNATFGGKDVQHELVSEVVGDSGESTVDWVFLAQEEQHYDLCVRNVFHASDGGGKVTMKGIADHRAFVECHGSIVIGEGGRGTNTHLTQHVLMLDASAKVDAVPALEIKTNDVKASHSATVTKISADDLFYIGSRGIPKEEARRLCIEGFLADLVERVPVALVQDELRALFHTIV